MKKKNVGKAEFRRIAPVLLSALLLAGMVAVALGQNPTPEEQMNRKRGPTFAADYKFSGSDISKWQTVGAAKWTAQNGEIVGTPTQPGGGWLVLDKAYQDSKVYSDVLCTAGCKAGIMLRTEKTPDGGLRGVLYSVTEGDAGAYLVTINAQGVETSRQKLEAPAGRGGAGRGGAGGRGGAVQLGNPNIVTPTQPVSLANYPPGTIIAQGSPMPPPSAELDAKFPELVAPPTGDWKPGKTNEVEILLTENNISPKFNGGRSTAAAGHLTGDEENSYGQVAFWVGGTAAVHINDIQTQDLLKQANPIAEVSKNFRAQELDATFVSWGPAVGDFNHDGIPDVVAGPYIFLGPNFTEKRLIYTPNAASPLTGFPGSNSMIQLAYDFTGDGWDDILEMMGNTAGGNAIGTLFVNPHNESRYWKQYPVIDHMGNEDQMLVDIDGDGKPAVLYAGENTIRYAKPDPANPTGKWIVHTISEPGLWASGVSHGFGVGDINGDGRMDVLTAWGWWEHPADNSGGKLWKYHPVEFGRSGSSQGGQFSTAFPGGAGGADLAVYDVNGDGLPDVVTSLEGHGFGLAWFEQKRDKDGNISFIRHMIMDDFTTKNAGDVTFTQLHGGMAADMDGDGIPDYVVGKRFMSHAGYMDPDSYGPPVVYIYHTVRDPKAPGGARFVPELVSNRAGVGSRIVLTDMDGDGSPDIVTSANFGTFVFFNNIKPKVKPKAH